MSHAEAGPKSKCEENQHKIQEEIQQNNFHI